VTGASGAALAVIEGEARRTGAPLLRLGRELLVEETATDSGFVVRLTTPRGGRRVCHAGLAARVHVWSLALAVAALEEALPDAAPAISGELLSRAFAQVRLAGRFELFPPRRPGAPRVLFDSAHTAESVADLFTDLALRFPGTPVQLVFGCAADKRWRQGLSAVAGLVDRACVAPISSPRSEDPVRIAEHLRELGVPVSVHTSGAGALRAAEEAGGAGGLVVVTGSGYLVGEVREQFVTSPEEPHERARRDA
jgi:folylpolyglutamate synthase/dihydropteroate synthase